MITFGFKNKFSGWLRSISAIALGIVIVIYPDTSLSLIVKVLAAFLIASGIVSLGYGIINRQRGVLPLMITNALVNIAAGIVLFCFPNEIAHFVIILIGVVILLWGIWEFIVLASAAKFTHAGFPTFIFPILSIVLGIILLTKSGEVTKLIVIIAGIAMIVFGVSEFLSTWRMNRAMKARNLKSAADNEVDEQTTEAAEDGKEPIEEAEKADE